MVTVVGLLGVLWGIITPQPSHCSLLWSIFLADLIHLHTVLCLAIGPIYCRPLPVLITQALSSSLLCNSQWTYWSPRAFINQLKRGEIMKVQKSLYKRQASKLSIQYSWVMPPFRFGFGELQLLHNGAQMEDSCRCKCQMILGLLFTNGLWIFLEQ